MRHRHFFRTKTEAETFADAQRTKILNEGQRGLALPDDVRVEAARCAERLRPSSETPALARRLVYVWRKE